MPPCGPYFATCNISLNNNVNTLHNGKCSENTPFFPVGVQIHQIEIVIHIVTSSCKCRQARLWWITGLSFGWIAQHTILKEALTGSCPRCPVSNIRRDRAMIVGAWSLTDHSGKKARSRHSASNNGCAGRNKAAGIGWIDNYKIQRNNTVAVECNRRQSGCYCTNPTWWRWGGKETESIRYRAGQARWYCWTWLGDGYNLQNGTLLHGLSLPVPDDSWQNYALAMGEPGCLLLQ